MDVLNIKNENVIPTGNIKLFVCHICNDCYTLERSFKLHYRAHKSFPCEVCKEVFTMKRDLNDHLRTHKYTHNDAKQKYICAECNGEFFSKYKVQKHMKCHDKRYICKLCKAEFGNIEELRLHKIIHKTYICNSCYESFRLKSELRGHVCAGIVQGFKPSDATIKYLKHPNVKQEVFDSEEALQSHGESDGKEKSYSDVLRTVVKQEADHITSSPDKPYFCEKCKKSFRRHSTLMCHRCTIKKKPRKYERKSISKSFQLI